MLILFAFNCYADGSTIDVGSPVIWKDESVNIPDEGMIISSELRLEGEVKLYGGSVSIVGRGRIIAGMNSNVTIDNVTFLSSGIEPGENEMPVNLISILGGAKSSFRVKDSEFIAEIEYSPDSSLNPWDQPPRYWIIAMPDTPKRYSSQTKLNIERSKFTSTNPYSVGAISIRPTARGKYAPIFSGEISGNSFSGFHGVIVAGNLSGFSITGNRLVKNTFANIFAGGDRVKIEDNVILYPGGGTTGDGITAIGKFTNSKIQKNTIFAGSCYGILLKGDQINNVDISSNSITSGITTAIQVESQKKSAKNILVSRNIISSNKGFAVTFIGVDDSSVDDNDFSDNAPGFPSQVYVERTSGINVTKNMVASPIGPDWAEKLELNRSHVSTDNSTFTLLPQ